MPLQRYVLRCTGCRAPVADTLRCCPYCAKPIRADALGAGVQAERQGHVTIRGVTVVVGAAPDETRECPFCGASVAVKDEHCGYCRARIVLRSLYLRSLTIEGGGGLTVFSGGSVTIGRPGAAPALSVAAAAGDLAGVRERLDAGDEIDATDDRKRTPLLLALEAGHLDVASFLVAMGATLDDPDAKGRTPLHVAAEKGLHDFVEVLLREGASPALKTRGGDTPARVAERAGHAALATRLSSLR